MWVRTIIHGDSRKESFFWAATQNAQIADRCHYRSHTPSSCRRFLIYLAPFSWNLFPTNCDFDNKGVQTEVMDIHEVTHRVTPIGDPIAKGFGRPMPRLWKTADHHAGVPKESGAFVRKKADIHKRRYADKEERFVQGDCIPSKKQNNS
ncbi:hypothetical protein TNCV_1085261 [Trichonephila clavipes]|nr:hypothetical protein TNCV_1085261 [Trichonephila clavipes]